ncbi:MAG TPA: hypothetical protein PLW10_18925 [Myxococcota bacterium]|nr:hypothetical protein [Myxococcota bacterium]
MRTKFTGSGWRRATIGIASLALGLGLASAATAAEDEGRWALAVRGGVGIHLQGLDASVRGSDLLPFIRTSPGFVDNPATVANEGFDVSIEGAPGDSAQTIEFRLGLRLYAPEDLLPLPERGRPRLFVQAGIEKPLDDGFVALRYDRNFDSGVSALYGTGRTVGEFCPDVPPTQACGYAARVNYDILLNWTVGFGADFTLPVWQDQFHLVPFVEYFGQAFETDAAFSVTLTQSLQSDARRVIKSSTGPDYLHGISAGLGYEVDVYENDYGNIRIFLESRATWILNDREVRYGAVNPTPTTNFSTADFMVRPSGFIVTTAFGLEFRWKGL